MRATLVAVLLCGLAAPAFAQADRLAEAERLVADGRYSDAKPILIALHRASPNDARAAYLLGRTHVVLGEHEPAAKPLERAVKAEPRNGEYHLWLGRAYGMQAQRAGILRQAGLAGKTKEAFERTIALDPDNLDARGHLIDFHLQAPGIVGGDKRRALRYAEEIAERSAWRGIFELARVHHAMGNTAGAERTMLDAIAAYPDSFNLRVGLSVQYQNERKWDAAYALVGPLATRTPPHAPSLYQVGRMGAVSGTELDRAEAALRTYLTMTPGANEPTHAAAHWRIGQILEHRGDGAGARAAYEAALRLEPNFQPAADALKKVR